MSAANNPSRSAWCVAFLVVLILNAICGIAVGRAASLRVEPILIDVPPPGAAATLTLRNDDPGDVTVQLRVFKWSQASGKETLEPTSDVVASPPALKLAPGNEYVVRIVRTSKRAMRAEESYRILVDQLPASREPQTAQINLLIRQSIPVFFGRPAETRPSVAWSLAYDGAALVATAKNNGGRRLGRLAHAPRRGGHNHFIRRRPAWLRAQPVDDELGRAARGGRIRSQGSIVLRAQGDTGPIHAVIPAPVRR